MWEFFLILEFSPGGQVCTHMAQSGSQNGEMRHYLALQEKYEHVVYSLCENMNLWHNLELGEWVTKFTSDFLIVHT